MTVQVQDTGIYNKLMLSAEKIGRLAEEEALEADLNATISKNVVQLIKEENINRLIWPKIYGEPQIDFTTFTDMIKKVGYYNMSASWLTYFYSLHNSWATFLPKHRMDEIFHADALLADIFAPMGKTEKVEGGFIINGKWDFVSGINYSDWVAVAAIHHFDGEPEPERLGLVVKVSELEIIENWNPLGLRGSGSNSIVIKDLFIPEDLTFRFNDIPSKKAFNEAIESDYLYYKPSYMSAFFIGFPAVALGGAERTISEYKKHILNVRRMDGSLKGETPKFQRVLAEMAINFQAAEALMKEYISLLEDKIDEYKPATTQALRAKVIKLCLDIVIKATVTLGAFVAIKGHPIEMISRDMINLSTHMTSLYEDALENYGKSELGFDVFSLG
ncbi:acyl-CoA dehydrogenase family protein [Oceanobacillus rekensis]|uniref:acyl-CoA dehydrogenase family protein n=1 Tax=Oceanobacillus rekensis TaxID=937927 RepID=UPI000B44C43E|nr:acyl-CoA dehydrogenase family protein [Oceanobacillus rekensis]